MAARPFFRSDERSLWSPWLFMSMAQGSGGSEGNDQGTGPRRRSTLNHKVSTFGRGLASAKNKRLGWWAQGALRPGARSTSSVDGTGTNGSIHLGESLWGQLISHLDRRERYHRGLGAIHGESKRDSIFASSWPRRRSKLMCSAGGL